MNITSGKHFIPKNNPIRFNKYTPFNVTRILNDPQF